jgi:hypothetical protein
MKEEWNQREEEEKVEDLRLKEQCKDENKEQNSTKCLKEWNKMKVKFVI